MRAPRALNIVVPTTFGEREGRVRWWVIEVGKQKRKIYCCAKPGLLANAEFDENECCGC